MCVIWKYKNSFLFTCCKEYLQRQQETSAERGINVFENLAYILMRLHIKFMSLAYGQITYLIPVGEREGLGW